VNSVVEVVDPVAGFEPLLQAPARLQVVALLARADEIEFARLRSLTATSDSVLSKHLGALAEAGLIKLRKAAAEGRQRTWARITREGRARFDDHVAALQRIVGG
jgi:DNA-binding transcriptional ArsR family regulator